MRLKTFYAKTMTEAMQLVRQALGEEAIIVATREEQGGRRVRVTAAIDEAMEPVSKNIHFEFGQYLKQAESTPINRDGAASKPVMNKAPEWLAYDDEEEDGGVAEYLSEVLLRHAVPNEVMDTIITAAMLVGGEDPRRVLTQALGNLFTFTTIGEARPVMLVGAPGSGKTLMAAKLAAQSALAGQKVAVITTDVVRAGAREQLEAFMRILGITLQTAKTPAELAQQVGQAQAAGARRIIIDTGGGNPFDPEDMRDMARFLQAVPVDAALVLPAGLDADEAAEIARVYAVLGVGALLPTRLDIARRMGGILGAAHKGGMMFAMAAHSPGVADGLMTLSPVTLAKTLMPHHNKEKTTRGNI